MALFFPPVLHAFSTLNLRTGLTLKGIYGREMYETWYKMSNMLVAGLQERIQPVITHRLKFEQFEVRVRVRVRVCVCVCV